MDNAYKQIFVEYQDNLREMLSSSERINIEEIRLSFIDQKLNSFGLDDLEIDFVAFVRCELVGIQFSKCYLESCLIFENSIHQLKFETCSLRDSQFRDNRSQKIVFKESDLSKVQFSGSTFYDSEIIDCKMNWASLNNVVFENCVLTNLDLTGVTFSNVQFKNCQISNCKSVGDYKISLIEHPTGKIGESDDLLDLIQKNGLT